MSSISQIDAERAVLGCLMVSDHAFDEIEGVVTADSFQDERHARIFRIATELRRADKPVDSVSVSAALTADASENLHHEIVVYVGELLEANPNSANVLYHASLVRDAATRRGIQAIAHQMAKQVEDGSCETNDILCRADREILGLMERGSVGGAKSVSDVLVEIAEEPFVPPLPTGFCDLDRILNGGLQRGKFVVLAARPSMGKTALLGNILLNVAQNGTACLCYTLEQTNRELVTRMLSSLSGVDADVLQGERQPTDDEKQKLFQAENRLSAFGDTLRLDDDAGVTLPMIKARSRLEKRKQGTALIVVDYLQLIPPEDERVPREQQVASQSRQLKWLAKDLDVPVICLAQLNRQNENRPDKTPRLADLRESGSIEQDADVVIFPHRPHYYDPNQEPESKAILNIAKNRNGKTGSIELHWDPPTMTFKNAAPKYQEGWPEGEFS